MAEKRSALISVPYIKNRAFFETKWLRLSYEGGEEKTVSNYLYNEEGEFT